MDGIASCVPLIARPSYDRACSLVPSEYVLAWEWFLREEQRGEIWEKLPHNITSESPQYPYRMTIDPSPFVSRAMLVFIGRAVDVSNIRQKGPLRSRCIALQAEDIPMFRRFTSMMARGYSSTRRIAPRLKASLTKTLTKR